MAKSHSMHAAKTNLSRLVQRAARGEEVVISRGKTPVARLVAVTLEPTARVFGAMKGRAKVTDPFFDPLPGANLKTWSE